MTDIRSPETSANWRDADSHAEAATRYLTLLTEMIAEHKRRTSDLLRLDRAVRRSRSAAASATMPRRWRAASGRPAAWSASMPARR